MGAFGGPQPDLEAATRQTFERHWRAPGYTCPNAERYPWQWLWDSAFHSIVWGQLDDERAVVELSTLLSGQDPATGFVPHVGYHADPGYLADFWGRPGWSTIGQPPMFGHAVAALSARGVLIPDRLIAGAADGVAFFTRWRRRSPAGLVELVHPWESGADNSLRWDDLMGGDAASAEELFARKGELLGAIERTETGAPIASPAFAVGSVAMTALVAFNAAELGTILGDAALVSSGRDLGDALTSRWDDELATWVDDGPTASGSGRARSLEALLGVLVDPDERHVGAAFDQLVDPRVHGARFGPTGVHRAEPDYAPDTYWRGPAWPQLTYLFWVAASRRGRSDIAAHLRMSLVAGALSSRLAEYWNPDTGEGLGAIPQSWAGLALVVDRS